ncbi:MAG: hypothetical protein MUE96_08815 [Bacteroidia bacterium]|jgi:hypothetical protein|nr:hypothetical protein [Bacteroidia bacterium]
MKTINYLPLALLAASLTFSGCDEHDHDDDHNHEHKKPTVSFINPTEGATYNEGDTLWLRVNMKSEEDLHDYSLEVKNLTTGATEYTYGGHSHNKELTTALSYVPNVDATSVMQLIVINKDHDGNEQQRKAVNFTINNVSNTQIPKINLLSPTANSHFHNGSKMRIRGNFEHNSNLKEASIVLKKNGSVVLDYSPVLSSTKTYAFDTTHTINTSGHSDYDLVITVKDHDNNTNSRTMSFHVH